VKWFAVALLGLVQSPLVVHDDPRLPVPPVLAPAPQFSPEDYIAECQGLTDAWRQYQELERQVNGLLRDP
jgi:hypothetical protein